jgi:glycerophosphoryl diester phosphodiesterase
VEFIGHRGAPVDAPENTIASFRAAFEQGVDGVELDVRLSRDGRLVVMHDETTGRMAGPPNSMVSDLTAPQLRQLEIKWKGHSPEKVPMLEDVIPLIPPGRRLFIESKVGPAFITPLRTAFKEAAADPARFVIMSFDLESMRQAKLAFRDFEVLWLGSPRRGVRTRPTVTELISAAKGAGLDGLNLNCTFPIKKPFVEKIHAAGLKVYTWTVDGPKIARREVEAGVDGITSNRAAWLRSQLGTGP